MIVSIFNDKYIKRNSLKAWMLAARPKTLTGAAVPVMLGAGCAWHDLSNGSFEATSSFGWLPMLLCFLFAFIMQIDANFINDYFDCVKKKDNEKRLGPERACQQGWVSLPAMKCAIVITTLLACVIGLPLVYYGGMEMIAIGVLCVVFCFLYTTLFSDIGMGDVLVLLFFGIVPVCGTWWVTLPHDISLSYGCLPVLSQSILNVIPTSAFINPFVLSVSCGLVVDTLLIINNYRDINNDREVGKRTLVVLIGKKSTEWLYICLPTMALVMVLLLFGWTNMNIILAFGVYYFYTGTWNMMKQIGEGRALNKVLGLTARNIFIYGILITLLVILQ